MEKEIQNTKQTSFEELSLVDQAKSLNAQITGVEKAINAHLKKAKAEGKDMYDIREKYIVQMEKIITAIG
jgi:hypothetical protein